ncbi:glycosyltransferase [Candidatus Micrarchaeota archaeon]|nr:glycosyltransferase [Candidatus Micrarchaeota archaeon]
MLSIIIPIYNEGKNLKELYKEINKYVKEKHEILIVDDASMDNTQEVIKEIDVRYFRRERKISLSDAVVFGIGKAEGEYICVMDGDLQHPPSVIPKMCSLAKKNKKIIVIGSRFVKDLGNEQRWDSRIATFFVRSLLGLRVKDPMSGFFLFRRKDIEGVELKPHGYKIMLEVLVRGGLKPIEVPFGFRKRKGGESKLNMQTRFELILQMIELCHFKIKQ